MKIFTKSKLITRTNSLLKNLAMFQTICLSALYEHVPLIRVRFNNSWFVFYDFSKSFHEPYFSRKHILYELYRVNRIQDYGFKKLQISTKLFVNLITLKLFLSTTVASPIS